MTHAPVTLRSPLGFAFRVFAFTTLLCALTCYRAVGYSWGHAQGLHFASRSIALESGWLRVIRYQYDPFPIVLGCNPQPLTAAHVADRIRAHPWVRVPEPLGFSHGLVNAMFIPTREISRAAAPCELATIYTFPLWPIALLTILPALRFARYRYTQRIQRRRLRKGCCIECGYDLRHSPLRCPECGLETPAPAEPEGIRRAA